MANKGKCQVCPKFSESRCSWCKLVFYCSKEHQKQDWPHHKETCTKKKYRSEENEELGRHLVATEDIKQDLILFKDKPLLLSYKLDTLEYTRNRICVGCYKEIPIEPREYRKEDKKAQSSGGQKADKKQGRGVRSGNNVDNDEEKDDNDEESSSSEDEDDDDDDDDDDESDDSDDEDNDDDEDEKVCLSCHLPVCSAPCSSQYFHKNFECKLLREAASHHLQQQLQQNSTAVVVEGASSTSTPLAIAESGMKTQNPGKKGETTTTTTTTSATSVSLPSSLSSPTSLESNSSSNQESMSLGTTCINTSCSRSSSTNRTSISNGIREALLRNLLYFRCLLLKHVNEGHWNELISLQSNEESRNDVTSLEKTTRIHTLIKKTLAEINHPSVNQVYKPDVHKIVGIIEINALNISISQNVEVSGIFPTFSLLEHSCIPTVKYYLVPCSSSSSSEKKNKTSFFELYCRSAVKLKSGDHLSVAFTNAMWNTEKRREFLQKEKHFWCDCVRCKDAWELGSNFSTILCPLQECKAASVPVLKNPSAGGAVSNSHEIQWKCTAAKCGKTCAAWQVKKVDTKLCEMVGKTKPSIESYKECLSKMEELVHPDYYLCCIVTHSLIQMYGHDNHDKALLEEKIALCNKLLGMIKKLDPGLAILNIYASVVFYEMHSAILAMAGAEVDEDYHILRNNPETVNLAKVYLQKCIECFKYELLELPENKLKVLAAKKMEYLNLVMNKRQ